MKHIFLILLLAYWPLPSNKGVTGTFSEYRFNHLHAGFDLSTHGKTGLAVKCYEDGYVFMIKVNKNGYGNVLYVKHPGKKLISVYGHLKRFSPEIEKIADFYRKKRKTRYPGTIILEKNKIKVKKGETIAYSGESGAGLPHLHFELRDLANNPVDASEFGFDMRFDSSYPVIEGLKIIPQDCFSGIDHSFKTYYLKAKKIKSNLYRVRSFKINGNVFFVLNAYDKAGRSKVGVKSIEFKVNGITVYSFDANKFSYDNYRESCVIYDMADTSLSPTIYFYNLFKIKGSKISVSRENRDKVLKEGVNFFTVKVSDFHSNTSYLKGKFFYSAKPVRAKGKFSPDQFFDGEKYRYADKLKDIILKDNFGIFSYCNLKKEYEFKNMTVEIEGYNVKPRLVKVEKTATVRDFLPPVEDGFFKLTPVSEFIKNVKFSIKVKCDDKKAGLYIFNKHKKKWIYLDGEEIKRGDFTVCKGETYRLGEIGVFIDNSPPKIIGNPFIYDGYFVWKVRDKGKGIDQKEIVLEGEREKYLCEYDNDRKWVFFHKPLPKGKYKLTVKDKAGNSTVKEGVLK